MKDNPQSSEYETNLKPGIELAHGDEVPLVYRLPWRCEDINTKTDEAAYDAIQEIFKACRPLLARDVYARIGPRHGVPTKTVICPMALKMGITKVKRKSGWWWVPPGVKEPSLAATREDPWAEVPPRMTRVVPATPVRALVP